MPPLLRWEKPKLLKPSQCALPFKNGFSAMASSLLPMSLPSRRETHLWYVIPDEIKEHHLLDQYLGILSPTEKYDVLCRSGRSQKGALVTRALVRTTISRYTNCKVSPKSLKFNKNNFGKPKVDWQHQENWNAPNLHFNISHTPSLIACGVTIDVAIGVDVEMKLRQLRNNVLLFAQRYFTPQEVKFLRALPDLETQRQEVIKIWTLKEAYVKALGRGFSAAPFRNFVLQFKSCNDKNEQTVSNQGSEVSIKPCHDHEIFTTGWEFALFELESSHYAAICVGKDNIAKGEEEGKSPRLKIWKTVPYVEDVYVSGTDKVVPICGFT